MECSPDPIEGSDARLRVRRCGAFCEMARGWLAYQNQRHIPSNATEETKLDGSEDSQRSLHRSRQGMRKLKVTEKLVGLPPETLNLHVRTVSTAGLSRSSSSGFTIRTSVTLPSVFTMTER